MIRTRSIVFSIYFVFACSAYAQDAVRVALIPVPWLAHGEGPPTLPAPSDPAIGAVADTLVYSNTNYNYFNPNAFFPAGAGFTVADDLHMIMPGRITQAFCWYVEPERTVVFFTFAIYAYEADGSVGRLLAGPYNKGPHTPGAYKVHLTWVNPVYLEADLWFAISFTSPSAGLVMANPPFTGSSNPTYYDFAQGRTAQLVGSEGPVPANFYLQIFVEKDPVAVSPATWSQVKALYRTAPGAPRD